MHSISQIHLVYGLVYYHIEISTSASDLLHIVVIEINLSSEIREAFAHTLVILLVVSKSISIKVFNIVKN